MPINVEEVAHEVLNRVIDRVGIAMLEALSKAPRKTLRWEDRREDVKKPPAPGAPPGSPPRVVSEIVAGLERTVNEWCDDHLYLTVIPQEPLRERHVKTGEMIEHKREPIVHRCTIARLETMVMGTSSCPGLIEHLGAPDEQTASMPTRLLKLSETGEVMLALWRENRVPKVPYPDPAPPAAVETAKEPERKREKVGA